MTDNVIVTGATGMIGKAVLLECLDSPLVGGVTVVTRRPVGMAHAKLTEIIHADLSDVESIADRLSGFAACFFCVGVSSAGMNEADYTRLTYDLTVSFARTLYRLNPDMVFNYVSGTGTDSSESGRMMWARVKGRTENELLDMGFRDAHMFRIGFVLPERGVQPTGGWTRALYQIASPLFPLIMRLPGTTTSRRVGQAMINTIHHSRDRKILDTAEINALAAAKR